MNDQHTDDSGTDEDEARLLKVLGNILTLSVHETFVIAQLEASELLNPAPATIRISGSTTLRDRIGALIRGLGGPPRLLNEKRGRDLPEYDTYAAAAIREILSSFDRTRTSVLRTHLYCLGSSMLTKVPEVMELPADPSLREAIVAEAHGRFWEHAETSFIRLASYWDRIGQFLDFAFFNIRRYDRDNFASVMDRIHVNILSG